MHQTPLPGDSRVSQTRPGVWDIAALGGMHTLEFLRRLKSTPTFQNSELQSNQNAKRLLWSFVLSWGQQASLMQKWKLVICVTQTATASGMPSLNDRMEQHWDPQWVKHVNDRTEEGWNVGCAP